MKAGDQFHYATRTYRVLSVEACDVVCVDTRTGTEHSFDRMFAEKLPRDRDLADAGEAPALAPKTSTGWCW